LLAFIMMAAAKLLADKLRDLGESLVDDEDRGIDTSLTPCIVDTRPSRWPHYTTSVAWSSCWAGSIPTGIIQTMLVCTEPAQHDHHVTLVV
jgi:hypothetical protein